jgi:hypothetical protein
LGRGWGRGDVVVVGSEVVDGGGFDDMAGDIAGWK